MKIRVIFPVTSLFVKETMHNVYLEKACQDAKISFTNLDKGPASIECLYEDALAVPQIIARAIEAERDGVEAVIIDCMNDPGLEASREAVSIPVVGAAQSAMLLASLLAHKFSIIGTAARDVYPNEKLVRRYGLTEKYASTRWVDIPVLDLYQEHDKLLAALVEESAKAIQQDGAQAIILGCTGMKDMASVVEAGLRLRGLDTIVIDPSLAALKWAEMLASLRLSPSRRTYPKIGEKLLAEHQVISIQTYPDHPGRLHSNPNLHILVPVIRGYRIDTWLDEGAQAYGMFARQGTTLTVKAIESGPVTIETPYDAAMAVPGMLRLTRQAEQEGASAVIIDCMSDPGLDPAREAATIPIVGPAQTSMFVAAALGHRFSILATRADIAHKFTNQVEEYGLASKLASVRSVGLSVEEVESNPAKVIDALVQAAEIAVLQDGAHILIPGCTGMIGLASRLQQALEEKGIRVPVIEPPAVAVKMAEALSDLNLAQSKITYPLPPRKALAGYADLEM